MFVSLLMGNKEFNIPFSFSEEEIEKLQVGDYLASKSSKNYFTTISRGIK